jgi:hypothetical protein
MKVEVVVRIARSDRGTGSQPLEGGCLGAVPSSRLGDDAGLEHASEIGDAEQEDEQHRENEGEFDQGLAATHGPCVVAIE